MRHALVLGVAALAGCGDNAPACGYVEILVANRNVWGGHIAVDDDRVYWSDYDNGAGTHLVFRQPREGGQPLVIGARGEASRFGFGMATDGSYVYWAAENEPAGYTLLATPVLGGRTLELSAISECTGNGIAVDSVNAYGGSIRCNGLPARVVAVPHAGGPSSIVWSSMDADVSSLAARDGEVLIATTAGLYHVTASGTALLDGRSIYQVEISGDDIIYSTLEEVRSLPYGGGLPHTLYTFHTPVDQPRPFAVDGDDLYVVEPPELIFVPRSGEPFSIVRDMGAAITHITARDGVAYWATLVAPDQLALFDVFSGGVFRVARPCQ